MQGEQSAIDFLKDHLQKVNKLKYFETIKQTINEAEQQDPTRMSSQQEMANTMELYQENYLKFMYRDTLMMNNSKSNYLIDESLNAVNAGLKTKKDCKYILSIITKIFVQELIEESLQVVDEYKKANLVNDQQHKEEQQNGSGSLNGRDSLVKKKPLPKLPQKIDIDVLQQAIRRRSLKRQTF